jgi:hypothetical protein
MRGIKLSGDPDVFGYFDIVTRDVVKRVRLGVDGLYRRVRNRLGLIRVVFVAYVVRGRRGGTISWSLLYISRNGLQISRPILTRYRHIPQLIARRKPPFFLSCSKSPSPSCCEFAAVLPARELTFIGAIGCIPA